MSNIYIQEPPTSGKVVMKTSVGDIDIELWTREAPKACKNFIQLCMEGYYDGTLFHRVVKGFIVQGGDPTGTGEGGQSIYGEPFKDEFHSRLRFVRRGLVAMANAGKNDNGSQFFFTLAATPELQNKHTIFGKVGGETIYNMLKLEDALVDESDKPIYPQTILKTEVITNPFTDIKPRVDPKSKSDDKSKKKESKKGVKNFKLLSFGEEAEEDEEETKEINKNFVGKSKSAHDNLADPKLSSQPVTEADDPPLKKKKIRENSDSDSEDYESAEEAEDNEKEQMKNRIKDKLKKKLPSTSKIQEIKKVNKEENESDEEEYYLGKDRVDAQKKKKIEIQKEIRNLKREMHNEKKAKLEDEKEKKDVIDKKEKASELLKEYHKTHEEYKEAQSKLPKKGASREDFTLQLLKKFKNKVEEIQEQNFDENVPESNANNDDDDDVTGTSWMQHKFKCEEAPVLAKDASTKGDDWFEIYDPRNPINKRRRGEIPGKSKDSKKK